MMLHKTFIAAAWLAFTCGFGQSAAQDRDAKEPQTVEELTRTVDELRARVEALEKRLYDMQSGGVAPEFERSIERLRELPKDPSASSTKVNSKNSRVVPYEQNWLHGVDAGMMIDALEHGIRWRETVAPAPLNEPVEGPTLLRSLPRR